MIGQRSSSLNGTHLKGYGHSEQGGGPWGAHTADRRKHGLFGKLGRFTEDIHTPTPTILQYCSPVHRYRERDP